MTQIIALFFALLFIEKAYSPRIERAERRILLFYGTTKRNYITLWKI